MTEQGQRAPTERNKWVTFGFLGLGMVCFGSGTPVSKIVTTEFPVFVASGLRMIVASLILLPMLALRQADPKPAMIRRGALVMVGIAMISMLHSVLLLYGMNEVSGVVGSTITSTTPAVAAVAALVFLHEYLSRRKWIGVVLAVVGVLMLNLDAGAGNEADGNQLTGSLFLIGAVCCSAGYTILGKIALKCLTPIVTAALTTFLTIILVAPLVYWQWHSFDFGNVTTRGWLALGWWGVGTLALGSFFWYAGLSWVEGSTAAGFTGVSPLSALVLSYLLLDEPFEVVQLAGFVVVFIGVLLIVQSHSGATNS